MEYVSCNLCGSNQTKLVYPGTIPDRSQPHPLAGAGGAEAYRCTSSGYGRHHAIVQCRNCGLIYSNPRWDDSDLMDSYEAVQDPLYLQEREGRVLTFERHLRPLEKITGPARGRRLLDVGCYIGVFLEIAAKHGWEAWGIEPSQWAAEQAKRQGLNVIHGTLSTADLPAESFDVATLWDVIEHLADPMAEIRRVQRVLKPGGLIVIHTMDIDSLFSRVMGSKWPWLMEMHIYYFSQRTMAAMLSKAGFDVIWSGPHGRFQTLGYLGTRFTALFGRWGRPVEWALNATRLRQMTAPINLGDLFTVYARKAFPDVA
jgi:2-polyprenyl-3-methyl-5-hydroxy-6-metoxy-1,4-benzoquinol methylase